VAVMTFRTHALSMVHSGMLNRQTLSPTIYSHPKSGIGMTFHTYEYIVYLSNTTTFVTFFYYLGQHVSTLIESSSGPSKIQIPLWGRKRLHCKHLGSHNAF